MLSATHRPFRLGFAATAAFGLLAVADPAPIAATSAGLLGCDEVVYDPDGLIDRNELGPQIARTAATLDAVLRVRVEGSLDGGLDQRIDQLRRQCARWDGGDGELADDLVVVMFSPAERENAIFFGESSGPAPDVRWDEATDAMIPHLQDGEYTEAVDAALRELRDVSSGSSAASGDDGGGSSGGVVLMVLAVFAAVGIGLFNKFRHAAGGGGGSWGVDDHVDADSGSGWFSGNSNSRRRRRSSAFGGAVHRSSRSSSRRSSSRSSRRAGGGSKKW